MNISAKRMITMTVLFDPCLYDREPRMNVRHVNRMQPAHGSRSTAHVWPEQVPPEEHGPSPLAVGGDGPLAEQPAPEKPTNYAWSQVDGYEGLLLYRLSPKLAERMYPWIATERVEAFLGLVQAFGGIFASLPVVSRRFPESWTMVTFIEYLPALQRLALVDLRVLRLLFREFDTLYLAGSMLLVLVITFPMFKPFVHWYGFNMSVTIFNAFILDAVSRRLLKIRLCKSPPQPSPHSPPPECRP
jgi:hypothetical protein